MNPHPSLLDKVVGVLARTVILGWVGGFVLLLVNSFVVKNHGLYLVSVGAIRAGFLVALIIVIAIVGSVIRQRIRGRPTE